jgi:flotillin
MIDPVALNALFVIVVIAFVALIMLVKNVLYVCQPNEVLVFSGRTRQTPDGRTVGYRVIKGGRTLRVPARDDLVELAVRGAWRGGSARQVKAASALREASGMSCANARGNLRGVLTIDAERVNQDEAIARLTEAGTIGEDQARARHAESERDRRRRLARSARYARHLDAGRSASDEVAPPGAELSSDADRVAIPGRRYARCQPPEERAQVLAAISQARAEIGMQHARVEQVKLRLQADVIEPAEAGRKRAEQQAKAAAASIVENGRATAEVLSNLSRTYRASGTSGRDVLLMQKLVPLLQQVSGTIGVLRVDKLGHRAQRRSRRQQRSRHVAHARERAGEGRDGADLPQMLKNRFGTGRVGADRVADK